MLSLIRELSKPGGRIVVLLIVLLVALIADQMHVSFAREMALGTLTTLLAMLAGHALPPVK